ncbi:hypothetical protein So717_00830 [Roseobacter cerasinus]|uniref:Uncharacterized protein n=1 Tax=Roseobacter cerasinus TaxID=2602289 RepID=A0A640VLR5_9RHOB|nr:hypothetical protein [Roseobacter cerasinus]GFE48330.1 hypothetical protein So717_00830 [Roseobacter cerasinus]
MINPVVVRHAERKAGVVQAPSETELLEEFGNDLAELSIDAEIQRDYLVTLWNIMVIFADLGFGLGPVCPKDGENQTRKLPDLRVDVLSLLDLKETPHETVAPRSTHNDEV